MKKLSAKRGLALGVLTILVAMMAAVFVAVGVEGARWIVYVSGVLGVLIVFGLLIAKVVGLLESDVK